MHPRNVCNHRNILQSLTLAYGQMILKSGFFHADPHPGNIMICKGSEASVQCIFIFIIIKSLSYSLYLSFSKICNFPFQVALLDYGQVKDLPDDLRLGYANLILAIADNDSIRASQSYKY